MVIVYTAKDIIEAQLVAGLLESRGIETYVGGQYLQGGVGELAAMDFAKISVDDADMAKARMIIDEYEASNPNRPAVDEPRSLWSAFIYIAIAVAIMLTMALIYA